MQWNRVVGRGLSLALVAVGSVFAIGCPGGGTSTETGTSTGDSESESAESTAGETTGEGDVMPKSVADLNRAAAERTLGKLPEAEDPGVLGWFVDLFKKP